MLLRHVGAEPEGAGIAAQGLGCGEHFPKRNLNAGDTIYQRP
jgi:hypothetical protein